MHTCTHARTHARTDGRTDGRTHARTTARTNAQTDGRTHASTETDGRRDGYTYVEAREHDILCTHVYIYIYLYIHTYIHTYILSCMHTYIYTHTHTYIYIYTTHTNNRTFLLYMCVYIRAHMGPEFGVRAGLRILSCTQSCLSPKRIRVLFCKPHASQLNPQPCTPNYPNHPNTNKTQDRKHAWGFRGLLFSSPCGLNTYELSD